MQIQITSQTQEGHRTYVTMQGERAEVIIGYNSNLNMVTVVYQNASHKAWRGAGKTFLGWERAKQNYKSSEMKGMLEYVESII